MKGLEAVSSREICINGKEIGFDYKIGHVVISLDKIFVSLNVLDYVVMGKDTLQSVDTKPIMKVVINDEYEWPRFRDTSKDVKGDDLNRVYCYDYEGNLFWQMKPPKFKKYPKFKECSISSIWYDHDKNKFFAHDYWGRDYDIDIETGKVKSFRAERDKKFRN